jgi:hypothetical protein
MEATMAEQHDTARAAQEDFSLAKFRETMHRHIDDAQCLANLNAGGMAFHLFAEHDKLLFDRVLASRPAAPPSRLVAAAEAIAHELAGHHLPVRKETEAELRAALAEAQQQRPAPGYATREREDFDAIDGERMWLEAEIANLRAQVEALTKERDQFRSSRDRMMQERDSWRASYEGEIHGHNALRRRFATTGDGTFAQFVERLAKERDEARAIIDTNDLCHNLHGKVDAQAFADGCAQEQRKLYGCAPHADKVDNQRRHIHSIERAFADLKQSGNLRAGKLRKHKQEIRRTYAEKELQLRKQGEIIANLRGAARDAVAKALGELRGWIGRRTFIHGEQSMDWVHGAASIINETRNRIDELLAERAPQPEPQERAAACVPAPMAMAGEQIKAQAEQFYGTTTDERDARLRALIEGIKDWSGETCVSDVFTAIADDLAALRKEGNRDG